MIVQEGAGMNLEDMRRILRKEYLSPYDVQQLFGISYPTVMRRIKEGKLPAEEVGHYLLTNKRFRIPRSVVLEIMEREYGIRFVDGEIIQEHTP